MAELEAKKTRYIFITGGVVSSLGKGIAASSLAALLQARGFSVRLRKLDPYLNVDPGTMSPFQHGEVFVTDDGAETDLDLGHYERFTGVSLGQSDAITSGRVFQKVLNKERRGDYLGGTVQVIPHVTDMIKDFIAVNDGDSDFMICEIGGTVGDIEGLPFMEAIRQKAQEDRDNVMFIHLTLLPYIPSAGELKTKPTQHSVKELRSIGIQPHLLLCRCDRSIPSEERRKIALFCNVPETAVIEARDVRTIYEVPLAYYEQGFDREVLRHFKLPTDNIPDLTGWRRLVDRFMRPAEGEVNIAIVGKYTGLLDAYKSLQEALIHGGIQNNVRLNLNWIDAEQVEAKEQSLDYIFSAADAILVPGGFGERGSEGKIAAVQYAREKNIPYFGICFGMQMAVIETARHLAHLDGASSTEFAECAIPLIGLMTQWSSSASDTSDIQTRKIDGDLGGTMRLGAYEATLLENSMVADIYGTQTITERHRHRYEVNIHYRETLEKAGLLMTGMSPDGLLPEIIERHDHPWFIAVQFHPELKSRPFEPHPLFVSFVKAALDKRRGVI
ncbi:MAG: CTP synthase [Alphaproteobacteria bacterium]|jgi:CTP synthase